MSKKERILAVIWLAIGAVQLWLWGAEWALHSCDICEPQAPAEKEA